MSRFSLITICVICGLLGCNFPEHYFEDPPECTGPPVELRDETPLSETGQTATHNFLRTKSPAGYRYFFKTFQEEKGQTYLIVDFRDGTHCFPVKMLVENWEKLEGMRRTNGKSYPKELYELTWKIERCGGGSEVVYHDMHRIID